MGISQSKKASLRALLEDRFFGACKNKNPRVLILGLGLQGGGVGAAKFFSCLGYDVTVTDKKTKRELAGSVEKLSGLKIKWKLGGTTNPIIDGADLIVKNPGIPDDSPLIIRADKKNIPVTNDGEVFLLAAPREKIIGITGTKGKTTTAMLISHILEGETALVGVPGVSFFEYFFLGREPKYIVSEFSSFDLERTRKSPAIAVITSLFEDHLNRYKSFKAYANAKMNIARHQQKGDCVFAVSTKKIRDALPKTKAKRVFVPEKRKHNIYAELSWRIAPPTLFLAEAVTRMLGVSEKKFFEAAKTFTAASGRLEIIASIRGSLWINDTTSTNPGSAEHSLAQIVKTFGSRPITVIAGGEDKNFSLKEVEGYAKALVGNYIRIILLAGSLTDKLLKFLPAQTPTFASMAEAVRCAAWQKGVIALIPGAASFNMFKNEFHRADEFVKELKLLRK